VDFDFTSTDYETFDRARGDFLDDVDTWVTAGSRQGFMRHHVDLFLSWNFEERELPLRSLGQADLADYLLAWLPRNYLGEPDDARAICRSLG